MNVSLPADLKAFVDEHVSDEGYASSSEYIRELIRRDRQRAHLRKLLLDGASSGVDTEADDAYFERLERRIDERAAQ